MSKPLAKALIAVRALVRLQVLAQHRECSAPENDEEQPHKEPLMRTTTGASSALSAHRAPSLASNHSMARSTLTAIGKKVPTQTRWIVKDLISLQGIITASYFNLLLVCVPLGIVASSLQWGAVSIFFLNFLALIPLALILGDITEDLALRFGDAVGGLLNATFGNVVEVILSITALMKGLYIVVATSLMGSILSNLLLVLGCSFFVGGVNYKTQKFNAMGNRTCASLLFLACIGIVIPTAAGHVITDTDVRADWILDVSRGTAVVLLLCYACYLVFQLFTHKELFEEGEDSDEEGEESMPLISTFSAITSLAAISLLVAVHSEYLTDTIQEVSSTTGLNQAFLGIIVLPIAGNACEHITAVIVAAKNKIDLSMGIAVGSSLQIALFAIPFAVVVGWATGHPMSLDFDMFSVIALALAVIHTNVVTGESKSHWLLGVTLIAVYILIAITYVYR